MENVTRALLIAFSMLIFVIAFSYSMYLINRLTTTSNTLLETVGTTNYYDNIKVSAGNTTTRNVGIDTIIPTLYRYYKENYAVKIMIKNGSGHELLQLFDVNVERNIARAAAASNDVFNKAHPKYDAQLTALNKSNYNNSNNKAYLFEAPWMGDPKGDTRFRIDYFLNGKKGYINNTEVDYSKDGPAFSGTNRNGFIEYCRNNGTERIFEESFVEYAYEGETISTENGVETITGNTQENSKIIITYKEI